MLKIAGGFLTCLLLAACSAVESPEGTGIDPTAEARRNMIIDGSSLTPAEFVDEMDRRWRLAREEMASVREPTVRAQVDREIFRLQIVEAVGNDDFGVHEVVRPTTEQTYLINARRLDNGAQIRVHVPDDVSSFSVGDVLDVVVGQHGYYFARIVSEQP
jgi:hypothetical protein